MKILRMEKDEVLNRGIYPVNYSMNIAITFIDALYPLLKAAMRCQHQDGMNIFVRGSSGVILGTMLYNKAYCDDDFQKLCIALHISRKDGEDAHQMHVEWYNSSKAVNPATIIIDDFSVSGHTIREVMKTIRRAQPSLEKIDYIMALTLQTNIVRHAELEKFEVGSILTRYGHGGDFMEEGMCKSSDLLSLSSFSDENAERNPYLVEEIKEIKLLPERTQNTMRIPFDLSDMIRELDIFFGRPSMGKISNMPRLVSWSEMDRVRDDPLYERFDIDSNTPCLPPRLTGTDRKKLF